MNKKTLANATLVATVFGLFPLTAGAAPAAVPAPGESIEAQEVRPAAEGLENTMPNAEEKGTDLRFTLKGITVDHEGMRLSDTAMNELLKDYVGREMGEKELNQAVDAITAYARSHGYPAATAYIPEQTAVNRKLTVKIEPGRYGKVQLENNSKLNTKVAEGILAGLKEGEIIRTCTLETALYNLRDLNGVETVGILSPGAAPGTSDLTVKVADRKQTSVILYAENYGSQSAGRYRYGIQFDYYNPFGTGGKFNLGFLLSNHEQHNYNFGYEMPVGHSTTRIGIGYSKSDYELGSIFTALGAEGKADTYSIYGRTPIINTYANNLSLIYGFNYRNITDELSRFNLSWKKHSYAFNLGLDGLIRKPGISLAYNVGVTTGTLVPDSAAADLIATAGDTKGCFTKGTFDITGVHAFSKHFDVMLKLSGQKAASNLDSSEHIYLGGAKGVRAYPQGEASGDEGVLGTIELRYHTKVKGLTLSTYFDAGHVNIGKSGGEGNMTLKGWGIGLTYVQPDNWFARLDYARRIGSDELMSQDAHSRQRVWFLAGKMF